MKQDPASFDVERRLARGGGAIPIVWLWPEVPPEEWLSAVRSIAGAARDVLAGRQAALSGRPEALSIAGYTSGMGPMLGWWIEQGAIRTDEAIAHLFRLHLKHNRIRNGRLRDAAGEAVRLFQSASIAVTLIKGIHTSVVYFPDPGARPMSDVDVVVSPADFERAERLLAANGFVEAGKLLSPPARRAWKPAESPPHVVSLTFVHADDPWSIDLQSSLDRCFASRTFARLQRLGGLVEAAPSPLDPSANVLRQPALALELAAHASQRLSSLNLLRLVELVLVLRRDSLAHSDFWPELLSAAQGAGLPGFVYPAFRFAEQLAPGTVPPHVLEACEAAAPRAVRRIVRHYDFASTHRVGRRSLSEAFMWCGGLGGRAHQAYRLLMPSSSPELNMGFAKFLGWRLRGLLSGFTRPPSEPRTE